MARSDIKIRFSEHKTKFFPHKCAVTFNRIFYLFLTFLQYHPHAYFEDM